LCIEKTNKKETKADRKRAGYLSKVRKKDKKDAGTTKISVGQKK
jgi:hypothetical protein